MQAPELEQRQLWATSERREAVRKFGHGIELVNEGIKSIKTELATLNMPLDSEDTAELLVQQLATTQLMLRCERTHRYIFGSQIVALHLMNNGGPQPEAALIAIFENARDQEPLFYGTYAFGSWIDFLIREVTVRKTERDLYTITVYGREYLHYIGVFANAPKPH